MRPSRRNKGMVVDGQLYRSKYEANQAKILIKEKINFEYEEHIVSFMEPISNGTCRDCDGTNVSKSRVYTPDFYFPETGIFVELKGKFDAPTRTKMKHVTEQCTEDIRMVFMRNNYVTRKHSMSYGRWCDLHEIQWAVGNIPKEWTR